MKKVFLISFLSVFAVLSGSAQKCKLLDPKTDSFTGEKTVQTKWNIMFGYDKENHDGINLNFGIIRRTKAQDTSVVIAFMVLPKFYVKITPDNTVDVKFTDGSILTLKCIVTREADYRLGDVEYLVPKDKYKEFITKRISMLRFSMLDKNGNTIYSNVSPFDGKNSDDFAFQFNCVLTN